MACSDLSACAMLSMTLTDVVFWDIFRGIFFLFIFTFDLHVCVCGKVLLLLVSILLEY